MWGGAIRKGKQGVGGRLQAHDSTPVMYCTVAPFEIAPRGMFQTRVSREAKKSPHCQNSMFIRKM